MNNYNITLFILFKRYGCAFLFILCVNLYKMPEYMVIYDGRNLLQESIYQNNGELCKK